MDGVIIDSEPLHKEVEQEILVELGVTLPASEHTKLAGVGKEMWTILKEQYGYNKEISEDEIHHIKRQRYLTRLTSQPIVPIPGIPALVRKAADLGLKVAIASSSSRENIVLVAASVGIDKYLDAVVSGDDVPQTKPHPAIFLEASRLLGVDPQECLVIEDSTNGIAAAKAAGMFCIGYRNLNSGNQNLDKADAVINTIDSSEHYLTYEAEN